ncbi:MAG: nucleotide exchange factor GrpE [Verrucomicrobiota bacterium]|jgi:molecular chaperone GrpE|nr:nucleotide exchange factor GrpE [Verrucomicrobiota bacterium]
MSKSKKTHSPHASPSSAKEQAPPPPTEDLPEVLEPEEVLSAEPALSQEEVLKDRLLRLQADFDNYRKRMDREKKDWVAYASEKLVTELLPILDHFELGLVNSRKNEAPDSLVEGFQLIYNQLQAAVAKAGVEPIDAEGQAFDPTLQEAITHMPSEDVPEGMVIAQVRRGYRMGDKLLRAAQVVVSSGPAD